jgi:hypothetical protein
VLRGKGAVARRGAGPRNWTATERGLAGEVKRRDEGLRGRSRRVRRGRKNGEGERGRGGLTSAARTMTAAAGRGTPATGTQRAGARRGSGGGSARRSSDGRELRRGSRVFVARKLGNGWKKSCATGEENCARAVSSLEIRTGVSIWKKHSAHQLLTRGPGWAAAVAALHALRALCAHNARVLGQALARAETWAAWLPRRVGCQASWAAGACGPRGCLRAGGGGGEAGAMGWLAGWAERGAGLSGGKGERGKGRLGRPSWAREGVGLKSISLFFSFFFLFSIYFSLTLCANK